MPIINELVSKIKQEIILRRNLILDNPFKYFNPFYKKEFLFLEKLLDLIDQIENYFKNPLK